MKKTIKKLALRRETVRLLGDEVVLARGGNTVPHTQPPRPVAGAGGLGNCDTLVAPCGNTNNCAPTTLCTAICNTATCNQNCGVA